MSINWLAVIGAVLAFAAAIDFICQLDIRWQARENEKVAAGDTRQRT